MTMMGSPDLNSVEIEAVEEYPPSSSVKIRGPPGTGKTTQIFARLVSLLQNTDLDVDVDVDVADICVVSYRRSLIWDLLYRLREAGILHGFDLQNPSQGQTRLMGTVHAISRRLMDGSPQIADNADRQEFCRQIGLRYDGEGSTGQLFFDIHDWLIATQTPISEAALSPAYDDFCDRLRRRVNVDRIVAEWRAYKTQNHLWDFDELLTHVARQDICPDVSVLVIDEMHDVYPAMYETLITWADQLRQTESTTGTGTGTGTGTVIVAGDPDQVINQYQGADPTYFEEFALPEIPLTTSYRVPREHWNVATDILTRSHENPGVHPISTGDINRVYSPELPSTENHSPADLLASEPESAHGNGSSDTDTDTDTMYLARTKSQCRRIAQSLVDSGILFHASTGIPAWNRRNQTNHERVALYNFCRFLDSIHPAQIEQNGWNPDSLSYSPAGNGDTDSDTDTDSTHEDAQQIRLPTEDAQISLQCVPVEYLTADHAHIDHQLTTSDQQTIGIESMLEYTTHEFCQTFCHCQPQSDSEAQAQLNERLTQLLIDEELINWIRPALAANHTHAHSHSQAQILSDPQRQLNVTVRTIHASKGTEADRVVLYDGITPAIRRSMYNSVQSRRNEHRVWFVALTRSSRELVIVSDAFDYTDPILGDLL